MFQNIGPLELVIILAVALMVFGPSKLPELGRALGRGVREFRRAAREVADDLDKAVQAEEDHPDAEPGQRRSDRRGDGGRVPGGAGF